MGRIRALPSPAMVIALLALVAGISGAAIAKGGKTVTKKQAKSIADHRIDARAPGLSVAHAGTASSAGTADSAKDADSVSGQRVIKVFAKVPSSPTLRTIATLGGGFRIEAACPSGHAEFQLNFDPPTGVDLKAAVVGDGSLGPAEIEGDDTAGPTSISLNGSANLGETTFSAATTDGTVVSGTIGFDGVTSFNSELVCAYYGQVTEG
jgi:hypothetical protein